jgi:DNA-binding transcriptional MerR regulator
MAQRLYRIGDAAELLGLKTHVLRYWETEFSQLRPVRTGKGQRRYTEADVATLGRIRYLLHDQGLTIDGARRVLAGESALSLHDEPASVSSPASSAGASSTDVSPDMPPVTPPDAPPAPVPASHSGKPPVQLFLETCLAGSENGPQDGSPARRNDGDGETIQRIADELRALLRLLRQN